MILCCDEVMEQVTDRGTYEIWECKCCGKRIEIDIHYNIKELD